MNQESLTLPREPYLNKVWRINNLFKIRSKDKGITRFKLNPLQIQILKDIQGQKPVRHFTLKTRQVGLSTFWLIYWLDDCLFRPGIVTGVMAHKLESIQHLTSIISIAIDSFPKGIEVKERNKTRITFTNDSSIICSLEFRSTPLHNLHISEWCFCDNEKVWATLGACSKHTNITGETTGNGMGNDGYTTWMDSQEGKNEYRSRFIPWFAHSEYSMSLNGGKPYNPDAREKKFNLTQDQIHFRRQKMSQLKNSFLVEYPETPEDAFAQSGVMFFNNKKIIALARDARLLDNEEPPKEFADNYTIWEMPQRGHIYAMGADVAEGLDGDYSCFKISCVTCRQEAMAYRAHVRIDNFYRDLNKWGLLYNRALMGVERNNHGHAVILGLVEDCKYPKLFKESEKETPIVIDLSKARPEPKWGWHTTAITKATMLNHLKIAIEGDEAEDENTFQPEYRVRDLHFLSECLTLQRNGNKLEAINGKHDDTVIASAICLQMYLVLKSKTVDQKTDLEKVVTGAPRVFS